MHASSVSLCSLNLSLLFVSLYVSLLLCLSRCLCLLSLSRSLSLLFLSLIHRHTVTCTIQIQWLLTGEPQPLSAALSEQNLFLPVRMRNARSGAAAGAPETLQNRLPSVEAESWNNEKLSLNSQFLPPALLRTGSFAFSLDANSPTRCKAKY